MVWKIFENEERGPYLVAREPGLKLRIRVYSDDAHHYSLELDSQLPEPQHDDAKKKLLSTLDLWLSAISATDIRDTSHETSN